MAARGQNVWFDLITTDLDGAKRFYTEVIGWTTQQWKDAPPDRPYTMWISDNRPLGGLIALSADARKNGVPSHWLASTVVDDAEAAVGRAQRLGGEILDPVTEVPTVGRFAVLRDPQGAVFSVFQPAADMRAPDEGNSPMALVCGSRRAVTSCASSTITRTLRPWRTIAASMCVPRRFSARRPRASRRWGRCPSRCLPVWGVLLRASASLTLRPRCICIPCGRKCDPWVPLSRSRFIVPAVQLKPCWTRATPTMHKDRIR